MSPHILRFNADGSTYYRAQYTLNRRIYSRIFLSHEQAKQWLHTQGAL